MVATLKSSVGKMNELLLRIAPKAGPRAVDPHPLELRSLLAGLVASYQLHHEVVLAGDTGAWVVADATALEQAVRHLLQNALDASPKGAPVTVRVSRENQRITIAIIDNGEGMDADFVRNRLFQPFASTKVDGFGVGAFEAKSLVSAMGGRLTVESRPGHGSRFLITLPLSERNAA